MVRRGALSFSGPADACLLGTLLDASGTLLDEQGRERWQKEMIGGLPSCNGGPHLAERQRPRAVSRARCVGLWRSASGERYAACGWTEPP